LGCVNGSVVLYNLPRAVTQIVRAAFVPTIIKCLKICCINFDAGSFSKKAREKMPGNLNASPLVTDAIPGRVDSGAKGAVSRRPL
jgi:hypothetical protein